MLLHHPVALRQREPARQRAAELAKGLPVVGCASRGGCGSTRGPTTRGTRGRRPADRSSANSCGGTSSRGAVDPHGALAVLERVVHAVHEVPGHRAAVDGAADPRGPPPGGVPLVVAGGVIDEAVVAVQLERLPAAPHRCRARAPARCLCVHTYERPCGETTSTPAGRRQRQIEHAAHADAPGSTETPLPPSNSEPSGSATAHQRCADAGRRAHRPRTASRPARRRRRSATASAGARRASAPCALEAAAERARATPGPRTGSSRMTCQYTPD